VTPGSAVRLHGLSPVLTVEQHEGGQVVVIWFDRQVDKFGSQKWTLQRTKVSPAALVLMKDES